MDFSATGLVISLVYTWGLGLAPAFLARKIERGPLPRRKATIIALTSCVILALTALALKIAAEDPHPRFSAAWIFVFFVSRWIMVRDGYNEASSKTAVAEPRLSREEMVERLKQMIANPSTTEQRRAWAQNRLEAFELRSHKQSTSLRRRSWPKDQFFRKPLKWAARGVVVVAVADVLLIVSGYRMLVKERVVHPGDAYVAGDWGDLGTYRKAALVCWYWTGRKLIPEASWYLRGTKARDECSVLHKHQSDE